MTTFKQHLIEAISLSSEKGKVRAIIMLALEKMTKYLYDVLWEEIESGQITGYNELENAVYKYVQEEGHIVIQKLLLSNYNKAPFNLRTLKFIDDMRADGSCDGKHITIASRFIDKIKDEYYGSACRTIDITIPFRNEFSQDKRQLWDVLNGYKMYNDVEKSLVPFIDVFLHELVHVVQTLPQNTRLANTGEYEYRSYLAKTRKQFNIAVQRKSTELDWQIYHGSPQEIEAFAHNMALELIDIATMGLDIDQMDDPKFIGNLEGLLLNIEDIVQYREFHSSKTYKDKYQEFNNSKNKLHYKVYKRFMKKVYLEIYRFMEYVKDHINRLKTRPDDWYMYD